MYVEPVDPWTVSISAHGLSVQTRGDLARRAIVMKRGLLACFSHSFKISSAIACPWVRELKWLHHDVVPGLGEAPPWVTWKHGEQYYDGQDSSESMVNCETPKSYLLHLFPRGTVFLSLVFSSVKWDVNNTYRFASLSEAGQQLTICWHVYYYCCHGWYYY